MKKLVTFTVAVAMGASAAVAQPYPSNGYIAVYNDANGTSCCSTVPNFQPVFVHVIANLAGATDTGMTGAEFRLEFSNLTAAQASMSFTANAAANLVLGNPVDQTPGEADPNSAADDTGVNIAFPSCQPSDNPLPGSKVVLGTLQIIIFANPAPASDILVKRKEPPSNATFQCPLFTLCDGPTFTKVCMTVTQDVLGTEPIASRSKINGCPSSDCGFVAVSNKTWSGVKSLFR